MKNEIKTLLINYLNNKHTKEELKQELSKKNIPYKKFNEYILKIFKKNTKNYSFQNIFKPEKKMCMKTNELLDSNFVEEIKEENKNRKFTKVDLLYKLPKEDLRKKLLQDPQLNQYFLIQKNDVFDLNDITFRLKRMCIEYGLTLKDETLSVTIQNGMLYYIKNMLDDCKLDNSVDEDKLVDHIMQNFPVLRLLPEK